MIFFYQTSNNTLIAPLSWISIQQKLVLTRQIVAELCQTHVHERQNEGELPHFSDKKALAES